MGRLSGGCGEAVWMMYGKIEGCGQAVWKLLRGCLQGVGWLSGGCG